MAVERASFGRWAYPAKLFVEYARGCPDLFLVACEDGRLAGYSLACRKAKFSELVSIAVGPEYRRSGVAGRLLASTVRRLRRAGERRLNLVVKDSNRGARRFYEDCGFRRVRVVAGYYEDGRDGVLMSLDL